MQPPTVIPNCEKCRFHCFNFNGVLPTAVVVANSIEQKNNLGSREMEEKAIVVIHEECTHI